MTAEALVRVPERATTEYVEELFGAITLDQLRLVLMGLYRDPSEAPSVRTRADATAQIWATGSSRARIAQEILRIEARAGMKHCFVARFNSSDGLPAFTAAPLRETFKLGRIDAHLAYVESSDVKNVAIFEHYVPVIEWVDVDDVTRTRRHTLQRHALVLHFDSKRSVATIAYAGFSQGSGTKASDRITYEYVISELCSFLREKYAISLSALPVHQALLLLQENESARVRIVRSEIELGEGKLLISSGDDERSVTDVVTDMLGPAATRTSRTELSAAITECLRDASANGLVTLWRREGVHTRALFWAHGAELLFIWNETTPSYETVSTIVNLLCDVATSILRPHGQDAWAVIGDLKPGEVISGHALIQRSGCDANAAQKVMFEAARAALLIPVYRLKTNDLVPTARLGWTRDLTSLARLHVTDGGVEIDGRDPRNVEVAFQRVREEPAA